MNLPETKDDIFEINRRIGSGINLGNALEAPVEGEWGVTLEEEHFQLISNRGFDSVRIPIRWSEHAEAEAPYTIDRLFMDRVTWAVDNSLERGLVTIINFHHYVEIFKDPDRHEERFLGMWSQVAEHFKDYPGELVFEILNEPHDALNPERWNFLLAKSLSAIRASNPGRAIMIGPGDFNNIMELKNLRLPANDHGLIVSVHYYLPLEFTNQGASWQEGSDSWLGTTWPTGPEQQSNLRADFQTAADWARENNRPMNLGEFGAYEKANLNARVNWTSSVTRSARECGFSLNYWEFAAGFGIYDSTSKNWNEPLLSALDLNEESTVLQKSPGFPGEYASTNRGVYFLCNDRLISLAIAFLKAFRKHNPDLPLCLIPYRDDDVEQLTALSKTFRFSIFKSSGALRTCDRIAARISPDDYRFRKLAMWQGMFDQFIYVDVDNLVLEDISHLFSLLDTYGFVVCESDCEENIKWSWKDSIFSSGLLTRQQIAFAGNTSFIVSRRGVIDPDDVLANISKVEALVPHMELYCGEQPLLNYLIVNSGQPHTSIWELARQGMYPDIGVGYWAGTPKSAENSAAMGPGGGLRKRNSPDKITFIHWSGLWQAGRKEQLFFRSLQRLGIMRNRNPVIRWWFPYKSLWLYYRYLG
ncbi:cellulase family glycosylhydrolase [Pseudomonadota bacterium]